MSRQKPLKFLYNNVLNSDYKPYLPIVGNKIPSKQIATFDGLDSLMFTQLTGTATGAYDYIKSYHGQGCYKVSLADNSSASVALDFTASPVDLTSLGRKQNNYAMINKTGKYGNLQDQLFFVLNLLQFTTSADSGLNLKIVIKNGSKVATLNNDYAPNITANKGAWVKIQWGQNSTYFDYTEGFTDVDFLNVTEIDIVFTTILTHGDIYLQDLWTALPQRYSNVSEIPNAYYSVNPSADCVFVSQLFGNDTNAGTVRSFKSAFGPVKTVEQGVANALVLAYTYVVILDGAIYKPIALDGSYVGIKQSITNNITITADYLETPTISAKPGLFDTNRVGARATLRTVFYENTPAAGIILTVGVGGTYSTIGAAHTAANAGDCIQIVDSNTYPETLICNKNITIEAAAGCVPIWIGAFNALDIGNYTVNVYGVIFRGSGTQLEKVVKVGNSGIINMSDCSFREAGGGIDGASIIYLNPTNTATQTISNCFFAENNSHVWMINNISGSSGKIKITNCKGFLKDTFRNVFMLAGKATASNVLNVFMVGNQCLGSVSSSTALFFYVGDSSSATQSTKVYSFFNETTLTSSGSGNGGLKCNLYYSNNYTHDINDTTFLGVVSITLPNSSSILQAAGNIFYNINLGVSFYIIGFDSSAGTGFVKNNIFLNCTSQASIMSYTSQATFNCDSNLFYNCNVGIFAKAGANFANEIFINCPVSVKTDAAAITVNLNTSIKDNSPVLIGAGSTLNSGTVQGTIIATVGLTDPANLNFSWYYNSVIETNFVAFGAFATSSFIAASGATLNLNFIDLEGFYNTAMLSAVSSVTTARYCNINNNLIGKYNAGGLVHCYNCFMTGNGQAIRENNSNIISQSTDKNNIIDTNGTGIMLLSGSDIEYNTIINNNYGITNVFSGFYNQSNYMIKYVILQNNIVARNAAWDYVGTLSTDYSIIPNRYFDSFPVTNANYVNTKGQHDQSGQPEIDAPVYFNQNLYTLDSYTYFPDVKYLGFMANSPAWQTASGTFLNAQGQPVSLNMGARSIPWITAVLDYAEYDFNYIGTLSDTDEFYALENPNTVEYSIQPINNESMRFITGEYENSPTAYVPELLLKWAAPGAEAKILDTGRAAFEGAFQGIWVVALSFDGGSTYIYYKVDKDGSMSMSQQSFIFSDTGTAPYGNYQLHLIQMPDTFVITDYLINNINNLEA